MKSIKENEFIDITKDIQNEFIDKYNREEITMDYLKGALLEFSLMQDMDTYFSNIPTEEVTK